MRARAAALVRDHPLLTPLFIVYGAINLLALAFIAPLSHFPVNLLLLAGYIALIHFATKDRPAAVAAVDASRARRRDIGFAIIVATLQLAAAVIFWFVIVPHGLQSSLAANLRHVGLNRVIASQAATAALAVPLLLFPTLLAVAGFSFSASDVGLTATPRDLALGIALAAIAVGLGIAYVATGRHAGLLWESNPLPVTGVAIVLQSLINGVPEELAYRGVIFGRLMPWLGRPGNSMAISSIVFGLFHVPMLIARGNSLGLALGIALFGIGEGLMFAYVFYRTRSIWPGAIWHTAITGVGLIAV
jgi:membrane protease YdiL (CAAX protease family)